jgi:hypothetical protein
MASYTELFQSMTAQLVVILLFTWTNLLSTQLLCVVCFIFIGSCSRPVFAVYSLSLYTVTFQHTSSNIFKYVCWSIAGELSRIFCTPLLTVSQKQLRNLSCNEHWTGDVLLAFPSSAVRVVGLLQQLRFPKGCPCHFLSGLVCSATLGNGRSVCQAGVRLGVADTRSRGRGTRKIAFGPVLIWSPCLKLSILPGMVQGPQECEAGVLLAR